MRTSIYYIFVPTQKFSELVSEFDQEWLADIGIWSVAETHRVGAEHSREEIEAAFWTVFRANLARITAVEGNEFETQCEALGLKGCWSVLTAGFCESSARLFDEAKDAEKRLKTSK